ncbi:protein of unknown function [Actinopolyspora xinjiangensis]|uniref:DUF397 domain-containing protein n=1 Tax=Actinopolyspora xinjiangensis TaxID=405564 RepID=A0A1H0NB23_9ACTN|nr:DUF397 domain-containing protein [Actinopolyspora xinjiangensis]SDO89838.1 protein of unknown function [Actinopolyspora xinjiangensis]
MNAGESPWTGTAWRKSSFSRPQGDCVEVSSAPEVVGVRDSKRGDASPVLVFDPLRWREFVAGLRDG